MNWGHGIAIFFFCFVAFMTSLVVMSFQQNIDLVTEDYYAEELKYQHQIEKERNTQLLDEQVTVKSEEGGIQLNFPKLSTPIGGQAQLFRPSDARFDLLTELEPDSENRQFISTGTLPAGFYKMKISWNAGGKDYYTEEGVHLR
mgnify:CR=1 FL=1